MIPFPRWLRLALAALLPILATGCIEFEKQTIYLVFPKDRDEVHALFVYEGLRVDAANADALKLAKEQLTPFVNEQAFCLWAWPLAVDLTPEPKDSPEQKKFKDLLRKHLTIKNGAFYTNADGKLCAYQHITIRDASKLVAANNDLFSEAILANKPPETKPPEAKPGESKAMDKETEEMIRKAARDHHAWLKLTPGQLSLNLPMTPASARTLKRGVLGVEEWATLLKALGDKPPKPEEKDRLRNEIEQFQMTATILADNPVSFDQRRDRVIVSLGVGEGEPIRVDLPSALSGPPREPTNVDKELADYAKTLSVKFRKDVTLDSLIDEFRKAHSSGKKGE